MKKLFLAILASSALFLQGCEGPVGPMGPAGEPGQTIYGEVIEIEGTFNETNGYKVDYDLKPVLEPGDKIVGFILEGEDNLGNDNWEPLPQTLFVNGNTYLFSFNFSKAGFTLFMDGNAPLNQFPSEKRTKRWFRVLIIPADLVGKVNEHSMNDIMGKLQIGENDIKKDIEVLNY